MSQPDIIVIGGGIAGVSAAALLAEGAKVLLIEAEPQLGYHSTGRSAAIYIANYGNAVLRALNAAAGPVLRAPEGICDRSLLSPRGELLIATPETLAELQAYAEGGSGLEWLSGQQAAELVPILRAERIAGALFEADAQDIDVDAMLQGYARLLRGRGGETLRGAPVTGLARQGGVWRVATGDGGHSAPIVINAAGAWADRVAALAGIAPVGLMPLRRSAVLLNAPEGYRIDDWPLFGTEAGEDNWYAKPDAGKLLISPAEEHPLDPQDAWPDDMVLAEGLDRFAQAVTIPITRPTHSWAGLRSFVADRTPVVGFEPTVEGFFWLAGQGGYGVQTAPALADACAGLCLGREPALDPSILSAIAPDRFRPNQRISTP